MKRWRSLPRRSLIATAVAAAVLGGAVAAAIAGVASGPATAPGPGLASVSATVRSNLAVFRLDRTDADTPPPGVERLLDDTAPGTGANSALARRALVTGGTSVYLVPSRGGVCLVSSPASQEFCAPESAVLSGAATASTDCSPVLPGDVVEISGIVPDGASNVTVQLSDGSTAPLHVTGNAYLARFSRSDPLPRSLEWDTAAGPQSTPTAVPADASTLDCVTPQDVQAGRGPSVPR